MEDLFSEYIQKANEARFHGDKEKNLRYAKLALDLEDEKLKRTTAVARVGIMTLLRCLCMGSRSVATPIAMEYGERALALASDSSFISACTSAWFVSLSTRTFSKSCLLQNSPIRIRITGSAPSSWMFTTFMKCWGKYISHKVNLSLQSHIVQKHTAWQNYYTLDITCQGTKENIKMACRPLGATNV